MGRRFEVGDIVVWSEDAYPEYKAIAGPFEVVEVNPYDIVECYVVAGVAIPGGEEIRHTSIELSRQLNIRRNGNNWNPCFFVLDVFLTEVHHEARRSTQEV